MCSPRPLSLFARSCPQPNQLKSTEAPRRFQRAERLTAPNPGRRRASLTSSAPALRRGSNAGAPKRTPHKTPAAAGSIPSLTVQAHLKTCQTSLHNPTLSHHTPSHSKHLSQKSRHSPGGQTRHGPNSQAKIRSGEVLAAPCSARTLTDALLLPSVPSSTIRR
jgi:hypothetical protein